MKIDKALDVLTIWRENKDNIESLYEAIGMAIESLEKQIPKKLKIKQKGNDILDFRCHLCDKKIISKVGERFVAGSKDNFCPNCGQALDWSDEK